MNRWTARWICGLLAAWLALAIIGPVWAAGAAGWQTADVIQKALQQAQLALSNGDTATTTQLVDQAKHAATNDLRPLLSRDTAVAMQALTAALARAAAAAKGDDLTLSGVALGLGGTLLVGFIVFALQAKLPYKKMLIVTGVMIGAVLLQMVGNTIHAMQVVGWMTIHPSRWLELPYWAGMWFGLYATWEGIGLQVGAAVFVIGSYLLAERMQHRQAKQPHVQAAPRVAALQRPLALREKESNTL